MGLESVPGAIATGCSLRKRSRDRGRNPVATAPGTDLSIRFMTSDKTESEKQITDQIRRVLDDGAIAVLVTLLESKHSLSALKLLVSGGGEEDWRLRRCRVEPGRDWRSTQVHARARRGEGDESVGICASVDKRWRFAPVV